MWPDRVSNPGTLTYESGALLTVLRSPAQGRHCLALLYYKLSSSPMSLKAQVS